MDPPTTAAHPERLPSDGGLCRTATRMIAYVDVVISGLVATFACGGVLFLWLLIFLMKSLDSLQEEKTLQMPIYKKMFKWNLPPRCPLHVSQGLYDLALLGLLLAAASIFKFWIAMKLVWASDPKTPVQKALSHAKGWRIYTAMTFLLLIPLTIYINFLDFFLNTFGFFVVLQLVIVIATVHQFIQELASEGNATAASLGPLARHPPEDANCRTATRIIAYADSILSGLVAVCACSFAITYCTIALIRAYDSVKREMQHKMTFYEWMIKLSQPQLLLPQDFKIFNGLVLPILAPVVASIFKLWTAMKLVSATDPKTDAWKARSQARMWSCLTLIIFISLIFLIDYFHFQEYPRNISGFLVVYQLLMAFATVCLFFRVVPFCDSFVSLAVTKVSGEGNEAGKQEPGQDLIMPAEAASQMKMETRPESGSC